tara:strand:- start:984 stop:1196 length:213 start_codon:yes stop_codon:yes gene_type:complete
MADLGLYEVEWTTESGGRPRPAGDEVVAKDEGEAMEAAYSDYYFLGPVECRYIGEPSADAVREYLAAKEP